MIIYTIYLTTFCIGVRYLKFISIINRKYNHPVLNVVMIY